MTNHGNVISTQKEVSHIMHEIHAEDYHKFILVDSVL